MTGLGMMLKALGVNVTEETVRQIETMLPQVPAVAQNIIVSVREFMTQCDARLTVLEQAERDRLRMMQGIDDKLSILLESRSENDGRRNTAITTTS